MTLKYDQGKPRWSLLPYKQVAEVVCVLTCGAKKYSDDDWKTVKPFKDRYFSAVMRHLVAWKNGERMDPETGLPHLSHAICCILFLAWGDDNVTNKTP